MEVTEKNTKAEILKAYETLLKDVQSAKADVPKRIQEEKQRKETRDKVAKISDEVIENASKIRMFTTKPEKEDN